MAKVEKRVLARCWWTNQFVKIHTKMKITTLEDVIWGHRFNSYMMSLFKSYDTRVSSSRQVEKHGHSPRNRYQRKNVKMAHSYARLWYKWPKSENLERIRVWVIPVFGHVFGDHCSILELYEVEDYLDLKFGVLSVYWRINLIFIWVLEFRYRSTIKRDPQMSIGTCTKSSNSCFEKSRVYPLISPLVSILFFQNMFYCSYRFNRDLSSSSLEI